MLKSPFTVFSDCENKLVLYNGLFYHSKIIIVNARFYFNHLTIKMVFGRKISFKAASHKVVPWKSTLNSGTSLQAALTKF